MFTNHNVVITVTSHSIGKESALDFAEQGTTVLVHYFVSPHSATETTAQITASGGQASLIQANLRQPQEIVCLVKGAHECLRPIEPGSTIQGPVPIRQNQSIGGVSVAFRGRYLAGLPH